LYFLPVGRSAFVKWFGITIELRICRVTCIVDKEGIAKNPQSESRQNYRAGVAAVDIIDGYWLVVGEVTMLTPFRKKENASLKPVSTYSLSHLIQNVLKDNPSF
jgi:hypothetical protein